MLPVHARTAGKTQQSFPKIVSLACPALPLSSHSSSSFLSPAQPITWQGHREFPIWADSVFFHWLSPSRKTNKTKRATKAKQISKQVIPSTLVSQAQPLRPIPVNLILVISHSLCDPTNLKNARLVFEGGISCLADIWQKGLVSIAHILH